MMMLTCSAENEGGDEVENPESDQAETEILHPSADVQPGKFFQPRHLRHGGAGGQRHGMK